MHLTEIATASSSGGGDGNNNNNRHSFGAWSPEFRAATRLLLRGATLLLLHLMFGPNSAEDEEDFADWASLWLSVYVGSFFILALTACGFSWFVASKILNKISSSSSSSLLPFPVASSSLMLPFPVASGLELLPVHPAALIVNLAADAAVCGWCSARQLLILWPVAELSIGIVIAVANRLRQVRSPRILLQALRNPFVVLSCALVGLCIGFGVFGGLLFFPSTDNSEPDALFIDSWEPLYDFVHTLFFLLVVRRVLVNCVVARSFGNIFNFVTEQPLPQQLKQRAGGGDVVAPAVYSSFLAFGSTASETAWVLLRGAGRCLVVTVGAMFLSKMVRLNGSTTDSVLDILVFVLADLSFVRAGSWFFWLSASTITALALLGGVAVAPPSTSSSPIPLTVISFVEVLKGASSSFSASSRSRSLVGYFATFFSLLVLPMNLSCVLWANAEGSGSGAATTSTSAHSGARALFHSTHRSLADILFGGQHQQQHQHHAGGGGSTAVLFRALRFFVGQLVASTVLFLLMYRSVSVLMWFLWVLLGTTITGALLALSSSFEITTPFIDAFNHALRCNNSNNDGVDDPESGVPRQHQSQDQKQQQEDQHQSTISFRGLISDIWDDSHERKLFLFFIFTASFMLVEFAVGASSDSLGLISDAFHMLVDATSIFIGLAAAHAARWKSTKAHPFGFSKYEALSGLFNGILLLVVAFHISIEAWSRMQQQRVVDSGRVIWVSIAGLLLNVVGVVFFHDFAHPSQSLSEPNTPAGGGNGASHAEHCPLCQHTNHGNTTQNEKAPSSPFDEHPTAVDEHAACEHVKRKAAAQAAIQASHEANMRGVFLHVLADLLGSVAVVTSSFIIQFTGWYAADAVCAMIVSVLILFASYSLLSATFETLTNEDEVIRLAELKRA